MNYQPIWAPQWDIYWVRPMQGDEYHLLGI